MSTVNNSQQIQPESALQNPTDRFWHNGEYQPELDPFSLLGELLVKKHNIADLGYEDKARILRGLYEEKLDQQKLQSAAQGSTQAKPATTKANKQSKARKRRSNKAQLPSVEQVAAHLKRCGSKRKEHQCCVWLYRQLKTQYERNGAGKVINRINMAKANSIAIPNDNSVPCTVKRAFKTMKELGIIRSDQPRIRGNNSNSVTNLSSEIIGGHVPPSKPKTKQPNRTQKTGQKTPQATGSEGSSNPSQKTPHSTKSEGSSNSSDPSHSLISEVNTKSQKTPQFKNPPTEGPSGSGSTASAPLRATAVSASQKDSKSFNRIPASEELIFVDGEAVPDGSLQPGDRLRYFNEVLTFVEYKPLSDDCVLIRDSDDSVVVYSPLTLRLSAAKL